MNSNPQVVEQEPQVRIVELLRGKRYYGMPDYFAVVHDHIECEDGAVYVAGYNIHQHPNGVPVNKLTLRRVSMKIGERRAVNRELMK